MKKINFGIIFYSFSQIELSQFVTISFLLKKLIRVGTFDTEKEQKATHKKAPKAVCSKLWCATYAFFATFCI